MATRSERKAERLRVKEEKTRKLSERYAVEFDIKTPVIVEEPKKLGKVITLDERAEALNKMPKINESLKVYSTNMSWCISISDIEGSWSWAEPRKWSEEEWRSELLRELQPYTKETWADLAKMATGTGGKGGKGKRRPRHHSQEISTLAPEAQQRWLALKLDQYETAYRFRLGGAKRAWGIQVGAHFFLVWFERYHKIYPLDR